MFPHPDLLGSQINQHRNDLLAEADHARAVTVALRRRRAARAAVRAARELTVCHQVSSTNSAKGLRTDELRPAA
jgi:hypothetical protein